MVYATLYAQIGGGYAAASSPVAVPRLVERRLPPCLHAFSVEADSQLH